MSWLPIIVLAALVFGLAVVLLKLPRSLWMLFGSALLFGLAGYAFISSRVVARPSWTRRGQRGLRGL